MFRVWLSTFIYLLSTSIVVSQKPYLYWSSSSHETKTTGLYSVPALSKDQETSMDRVIVNKIASLRYPHFLASLSSNDATQEITAIDIGRGNIVTLSTEDRSIVRHHGGVSRKVAGIAVDWSNGNIYWTDEERHWIAVAKWNLMRISPIITDVAEPRGIAVHPQKGYLFWSQVNRVKSLPEGEIMRSTMSGLDRKKIYSGIGLPNALSVDYEENKIYWIDTADNTLWSIDIDGETIPKYVYASIDSSLTGLTIYKKFVYVADHDSNEIIVIDKSTGTTETRLEVESPVGITISGGGHQSQFLGPCDKRNGGCDEFCFPQPPGNTRKCGCSVGLRLASNGTSCVSDLLTENFFIVVDSDMHWIFQISADGSKYARMNLPGVKVPVQVEFDPNTKMVYWTDVGLKTVNSAKWDGSGFKVLARKNVRQPTGLALDRLSGNLYWTDEGTGTINVIRVDGTHRKTLLSTNITSPRALAIDPFLGKMWWSDWTSKTIEIANMNGSNRTAVISDGINWPNGIAVDYNDKKLYWVDAHTDIIYVSNLDGSDKKIFKKLKSVHMFGIAVDKDYVYWTDWNDDSVMRISKNKPRGDPEVFGPKIFSKLCDIHNFVNVRNISKIEELKHPCAVNNGNCDGLCLPVPSNTENTTNISQQVSRLCVCGSQHSGNCDKPREGVNDTIAPSFNGTCPGDMIFTATPCQNSVFVNYTIPKPIDNSGKAVISKSPKNVPPVSLKEGRYEHSYVASDATGNTDVCHFSITVNVVKCPTVKDYLERFGNVTIVESSCENYYGSRVNVTCDNGLKLMSVDFIECGVDGEWKGQPMCYSESDEKIESPYEDIEESSRNDSVIIQRKESTTSAGNTNLLNTVQANTTEYAVTELSTTRLKTTTVSMTVAIPITTTTTTTVAVNPTTSFHDTNKGNKYKKGRSTKMDLIYLIIPAIVVVIIVIVAAIGYSYCKNRSMPILEAMEKRLTFLNLKEQNRDTVAFAENGIQQRPQSIPDDVSEIPYPEVEVSTSNISTVFQRNGQAGENMAIYAEPAFDLPSDGKKIPPAPPLRGSSYGSL